LRIFCTSCRSSMKNMVEIKNTRALLSPFDLLGLSLKNRVVMSPMTRARAGEERLPNPNQRRNRLVLAAAENYVFILLPEVRHQIRGRRSVGRSRRPLFLHNPI
jgi:hypothetical protein